MFFAALMSRSWNVPQLAHFQFLTDKSSFPPLNPQQEHF